MFVEKLKISILLQNIKNYKNDDSHGHDPPAKLYRGGRRPWAWLKHWQNNGAFPFFSEEQGSVLLSSQPFFFFRAFCMLCLTFLPFISTPLCR
jgi:hypothetical protein